MAVPPSAAAPAAETRPAVAAPEPARPAAADRPGGAAARGGGAWPFAVCALAVAGRLATRKPRRTATPCAAIDFSAPPAFPVAASTETSTLRHDVQPVEGRALVLPPRHEAHRELIFPASSIAAADEDSVDEEARDRARRIAAVIFVLGAGPSFFAQNELVWKKERARAREEEERKRKEEERKAKGGFKLEFGGGLPAEVQALVKARFRRSYPQKDVEALWAEVKRAYKSEAKALAAVSANPTILNPQYTRPPALIGRSKAALVSVLGEEEAIEVMLKNPALLQCGASLASQPAGQIKSFAAFRSLVDGLPAAAPLLVLGALAVVFFVALAGRNGALPAEADGLVKDTNEN